MHNVAVYPGTFDPLTNGHLDIIIRASRMFDTLIVAVAHSASKSPMFPLEIREAILREALVEYPRILVESFDTLLADFAESRNSLIIIRGLRAVSDFEYELQMGYANASLNPELETIYLMPSLQNAFISSSVVRSILSYQGKISHLVPQKVYEYIKAKGYVCM